MPWYTGFSSLFIKYAFGEKLELDGQLFSDVFKFDPDFEKHETEYEEIRRDAIGLPDESSDEEEEGASDEEPTETQPGFAFG